MDSLLGYKLDESEVVRQMGAPNAVQDWLEPDGLLLIESWARDGLVVEDIAIRIGVHPSTLRGWMNKYPEIKKAINNGRELVDYKVENALLKSALGYKTREVKVTTYIKNGKVLREEKEVVDKEFAPNVPAIQTWLYNRKPSVWKPANARANSILDNLDEDTNIHITVERASTSELQQSGQGGPSSFEEVDTDWQNDVNKEVVVRGLSEEEKKQQKLEKSSQNGGVHSADQSVYDGHTTVDDDDDWSEYGDTNDDDDWGNDIYDGR